MGINCHTIAGKLNENVQHTRTISASLSAVLDIYGRRSSPCVWCERDRQVMIIIFRFAESVSAIVLDRYVRWCGRRVYATKTVRDQINKTAHAFRDYIHVLNARILMSVIRFSCVE